MKEREALKLALEAAYLAGFNASGEGYNGEYPFGDKMQDPAENRVWKKDRDNYIKEALEQPEQFWHHNCPDSGETATQKGKPCNWCGAIEAQPEKKFVTIVDGPFNHRCPETLLHIKEILAHPEQKPAAVYTGETWCGSVVRLYENLQLETPLYTAPSKRTWVGLTLDERLELAQDVDWAAGAYCEYAEKIEAKLKEKNT